MMAEKEHLKNQREIIRALERIADALERSNKIKALELAAKKNENNNIKEDKNNE